jgi:hypothetical protein
VARSGSDTINGATSATIGVQYSSITFVADYETNQWFAASTGLGVSNVNVDAFSGDGSTVAFTLSGDPASENNTQVYVSGVYQEKDTYSVSGTTLTFSTAPPSGTSNIEVVWTSPLAIGTPSDGTVTTAKLASTTGSGAVVLATSPTLVTPTLGAASATSITVAAGAVGTPSITTTGDTNTGIFFPAADTIAFAEGGAEAMRIDSDGDVGIATSSPAYKLDVGTGSVVGNIHTRGSISSGTLTGFLIRDIPRLTNDTATLENTFIGCGATAGNIIFQQGSSLTSASNTERMRIDSSGNLLVGKTSVGTSNTGFEFTPASGVARINLTSSGTGVQSKIVFYNNSGTYCGEIYTGSGTSTTYSNASDYRLKEDVQTMQGSLSKVMALKPVTYKWKSDGAYGEGFIAHELQEVVPLAVSRHKDAVDADGNPEYQGVDQSKLVATLTAAIQELKALTDTQASTITALTARITALEN